MNQVLYPGADSAEDVNMKANLNVKTDIETA
jgi:hypothetical protein